MSFARLTLPALLGSLISLLIATIAQAETRAPYQSYLEGNCPTLVCAIDFPSVPLGKRLEITNVSCLARLRSGGAQPESAISVAQLRVVRSGGALASAINLAIGGSDNGVFNGLQYELRTSNEKVSTFATGGQHYRAFVQLTRGVFYQYSCNISGEMVTL